jgi:hypothetical protein
MAFNFPDGASNGQTHTASNGTVYRYNGTTWIVDSASTTTNFDTRYINANGDGVLSGSITTQLPSGVVSGSSQITDGSGILSGSVVTELPAGTVSGSSQLTSEFDTRYLNVNGDSVVSGSVLRTLNSTGVVSGSVLRNLDGTDVVSGSVLRTLNSTGVVSGSSQLDGYISSSTANIIQVMTSASYAAITPVSGTLYIIQG